MEQSMASGALVTNRTTERHLTRRKTTSVISYMHAFFEIKQIYHRYIIILLSPDIHTNFSPMLSPSNKSIFFSFSELGFCTNHYYNHVNRLSKGSLSKYKDVSVRSIIKYSKIRTVLCIQPDSFYDSMH